MGLVHQLIGIVNIIQADRSLKKTRVESRYLFCRTKYPAKWFLKANSDKEYYKEAFDADNTTPGMRFLNYVKNKDTVLVHVNVVKYFLLIIMIK